MYQFLVSQVGRLAENSHIQINGSFPFFKILLVEDSELQKPISLHMVTWIFAFEPGSEFPFDLPKTQNPYLSSL